MRYRSSIFPHTWPTSHPKLFSNPTFFTDLKYHLYNAFNSSVFLGLFLIFLFNYNDLLWANNIPGFSHPVYSYLQAEHFAFGDVLEYKEMTHSA